MVIIGVILWILCIWILPIEVDILKIYIGTKYLIFDSVDENKEVLKKYEEVWNGIKNKIKAISVDECNYGEDLKNMFVINVMIY